MQEEYQLEVQSDDFIRSTIGKTVRDVKITRLRSKSKDMHNDERLELFFTDGSLLSLEIGSNGDDLPQGPITASELSLSFVPVFREPHE